MFRIVRICGHGKTTLIVQIINYLLNNDLIRSVAFTAPTNKAVNVIKAKFRAELKTLIKSKIGKVDPNIYFDTSLDLLQDCGLKIDFITTHRLLNYQTEFDAEGNRVFIKGNNTDIMSYDLVFIDECSMLPAPLIVNLFDDIEKEINKDKKSFIKIPKIVFVGDPAQLPPVNELQSIIFNKDIKFKDFQKAFEKEDVDKDKLIKKQKNIKLKLSKMRTKTLQQIVRSDNDRVIGLCNNIRKFVMKEIGKPKLGHYQGKKVKVYKNDCDKLKSEWFQNFLKHRSSRTETTVILTWTNQQSDLYNNSVKIDKNKDYSPGDILMINDFYNFDELKSEKKSQFYTSEQIVVVGIEETIKGCNPFDCVLKRGTKMSCFRHIESKYREIVNSINNNTVRRYETYKLKCKRTIDRSDKTKDIYVIKKSSKEKHEKDKEYVTDAIKRLRQHYQIFYSDQMKQIDNHVIKHMWREYNKILIEPFANVTSGTSITCHRAQGSTFHNVFVDVDDILKNNNLDDANRCIYTALTRVSNEVHILI